MARCRARPLCLWLLLLALGLSSLLLSDLLTRGRGQPGPPSRPSSRIPSAPDLEVIVDSRDPAMELDVDPPPIQSLQEDQLLFVSSVGATKTPGQKKGAYRVLLPGTNKDNREGGAAVRAGEERGGGVHRQGFNEAASEGISVHRRLPEARHPACLQQQYGALPSASVVICFHNEAWSTLLRTVHSVLATAPPRLRELLLVDDLSQHGHLKGVLSEYLSHLGQVRLVRSPRRLGVGGCRALGAAEAQGDVLVFMDSHCECEEGWLEPLLERVARDRTTVVSPIIDVIDWRTFQFNATQWPVRGAFTWQLDFLWESYTWREGEPGSPVGALRSPVLGGEVFAIDRQFFQHVGGFDPGMLLWGEEQIELSIRVWSCGGSMEVVPCSRVAHLDHHRPPYAFPDQELLQNNKIRIAEVWMDSYRKIFYRRDTLAHFIRQSEKPNITERLQLQKNLGCKNFQWYLTTVYPQLYVPQDRPSLSGELYNVGTSSCADSPRGQGQRGGAMSVAPCSGTGSQHCELNSEAEIRWGAQGRLCFDAVGERVVASPCPARRPTIGSFRWKLVKPSAHLVHLQSQLCLEAVPPGGLARSPPTDASAHSGGLFLRPCSHHPRQQWHFDHLVE